QWSGDGGTTWALAGTTAADVTSATVSGLTAGKAYKFRVQATGTDGNSAYGPVASLAMPTVPNAPSTLTATAPYANRVVLKWLDRSTNESGFRIERSTDGGATWTRIGTTGANATSYTDTTTSARKTYKYRVRSYNVAGQSASTNYVTLTTPTAYASTTVKSKTPVLAPAHVAAAVFSNVRV
ncbi:MAG TPA: fibronectin type III domain-containing protein, partial [Humisphaera sp.]